MEIHNQNSVLQAISNATNRSGKYVSPFMSFYIWCCHNCEPCSEINFQIIFSRLYHMHEEHQKCNTYVCMYMCVCTTSTSWNLCKNFRICSEPARLRTLQLKMHAAGFRFLQNIGTLVPEYTQDRAPNIQHCGNSQCPTQTLYLLMTDALVTR
jgi:hypothetical protein